MLIDQGLLSRIPTCCAPCWGFQSKCLNVDSCLETGAEHRLASPITAHLLKRRVRQIEQAPVVALRALARFMSLSHPWEGVI